MTQPVNRADHTFKYGALVTHFSSFEVFKVINSRPYRTQVESIDGSWEMSFATVDLTIAD